jgi:hypothetical protein
MVQAEWQASCTEYEFPRLISPLHKAFGIEAGRLSVRETRFVISSEIVRGVDMSNKRLRKDAGIFDVKLLNIY